MDRLVDIFTGAPAALLAHPWWTLLGVVTAGGAYLGVLVVALRIEDRHDRRDREHAARLY